MPLPQILLNQRQKSKLTAAKERSLAQQFQESEAEPVDGLAALQSLGLLNIPQEQAMPSLSEAPAMMQAYNAPPPPSSEEMRAQEIMSALNSITPQSFTGPMQEDRDQLLRQAAETRKGALGMAPKPQRGPNLTEILGALALLAASGEQAGEVGRGLVQGYQQGRGQNEEQAQQEYNRKLQAAEVEARSLEGRAGIKAQDLAEYQQRIQRGEDIARSDKVIADQRRYEEQKSEKDFERDKELIRLRDQGKLSATQWNQLKNIAPEGRAAYAMSQLGITDPTTLDAIAALTTKERKDIESASLTKEKAISERVLRDPKKQKLLEETRQLVTGGKLKEAQAKLANWSAEYRRAATKWLPKEKASEINQRQFNQGIALERLAQGWARLDQGDQKALQGIQEDTAKLEDELQRKQGDMAVYSTRLKDLNDEIVGLTDSAEIAKTEAAIDEIVQQMAFLNTDIAIAGRAIERSRQSATSIPSRRGQSTRGGQKILGQTMQAGEEQLFQQAQNAIAAGADPQAVQKVLTQQLQQRRGGR